MDDVSPVVCTCGCRPSFARRCVADVPLSLAGCVRVCGGFVPHPRMACRSVAELPLVASRCVCVCACVANVLLSLAVVWLICPHGRLQVWVWVGGWLWVDGWAGVGGLGACGWVGVDDGKRSVFGRSGLPYGVDNQIII